MARARTAAGATSTLSELRPIEDELVGHRRRHPRRSWSRRSRRGHPRRSPRRAHRPPACRGAAGQYLGGRGDRGRCGRTARAAHPAWLGNRDVRCVRPGRRWHRRLLRADEPHRRDRPRQPRRRRRTGGHPRRARRGAGAARPRLPGLPWRAVGEPRGQRGDQCRRHASRQVRRDPPSRARRRSGARDR